MKHLKKMLALVMAICLVLGLTPNSAFAADTKPLAAAIFASDIHAKTTDVTSTSVSDTGVSTMKSIMSTIGSNGITYNTVGFVGDTYTDIAGEEANMTSAVQSALGQSAGVYYAWGDHDEESDISEDSALLYSGDHYYIYHISDIHMRDKADEGNSATITETQVTEQITEFKTAAASMDKSKVLFIMSHAPLHDRRSDNTWANNWYTAIAEVADAMDVVVFWAHNHTQEDSVDRAAYYVAKDGSESMTIYGGSTITPNFTYMNAGYIYPNGQSSSDVMRYGVATTVEIYDDCMVFQDYNSSGEYTDSSYSHNVTVAREFAAQKTLESISITTLPNTTYYVGDEFDSTGLVVTATYDDGTTSDVTGYTLSDVDMSTVGTKTITVTYEGKTATFDIVVNPTINTVTADAVYLEDEEYLKNGDMITAVGLGLTGVSAVFNEIDLSDVYGDSGVDYSVYDVTLSGYAGGDVSISFNVYNVDLTGSVITLVNEDGTVEKISGVVETTANGDDVDSVVTFTVPEASILEGKFTVAFGIQEIVIPDGYELIDLSITQDPLYVQYFVDEDYVLDTNTENLALDITGLEVTATYSDGSDTIEKVILWNSFNAEADGYALDFDMSIIGTQNVEVSYTYGDVTLTSTYEIDICYDNYKDSTTDVSVTFETPEVIKVAISKETVDADVEESLEMLLKDYVAYDFQFDGYTEGNAVTVTMPIPTNVSTVGLFHVADNGDLTRIADFTENEDGTITFVATAFSSYVIGEDIEIVVPEPETATGSDTTTTSTEKTVYVKVDSLEVGEEYLIVSNNYALVNNSGSVSSVGVTDNGEITINGTEYDGYIELDNDNAVWTVGTGYTFKNGNYYLGYETSSSGEGSNDKGNKTSYSVELSTSDTSWTYSGNYLYFTTSSGESGESTQDRYLYYGYNGWSLSTSTNGGNNSSRTVYFYKEVTYKVDTSVTVTGTYSIEGKDISAAVSSGTNVNLTSTLIYTPESGDVTTTDVSASATYEVVTVDADGNTVDGDPYDIITMIENGVVYFSGNYGTALVKVSYKSEYGTVTDYITIEAKAPYYTIQLHKADMTEVTITEFDEGVTYYTYDSTTNTYQIATEYVEGTTYYTTPVIQGEEITGTLALKGIEAGDTYSVWAVVTEYNGTYPLGHDMGALGDALTWSISDESIATIDTATGVITFTGTNYGTFTVTVSYKDASGNVITDTITISVTDSLYIVPGDGTNDFPEYPNQGAVRFDKTATAVGNFSETGIAQVELSMTGVPYSTGSAIDVLLVLDMSTSMKTEVESDVTRYDVTASATKAFVETIVKNDDGTYNSNTVAIHYFNGTTAYTDKITDGFITVSSDDELSDINDAIDALMADPPSTSGTDYSTSMEAAYDAIIARDAVSDNTQALVFMSDGGPTYYTYVDGDSYGTISDDAATIVGWFETDDNDTSDDETDDTATPNSSFKNEYYSTLLKNAGYPVYTVGLGLSNNDTGPSAFTGLTSGAHEAITSYILSQMATSSSYFYNVADSDAVANMGNIFSGIASAIKEAAKNVVVEDKIGSDYTVNFSLPTGITSDATDGIEDFYIQVVDYVLDTTTHERTGVYTVKENFTFDGETGALISHTVDGVTCTDCAHVTTTDGVITKIEGTYFSYEVKNDGEYLTWKEEKLSSTELALQYFVYLDNSAGTDVEDQVAAGTYYTNEYATLTYTNVNGNAVQQEFPIPQMTWNGAQVSYVFYLVNEAGQPVNRAGRVVPFAEAVYVTDVYTYSVIWNDMEQAAGLEAKYLAENLVPDVYALYDDDASYNIHVYEKESSVNLNNHFVVGGDVTDDYNKVTNSWTNAKTTYVFNNKSDTTKYNTVGTYVADDGDTDANETGLSYFCKSDAIEGATYTTTVENGVTVYTITSVGNGYQAVTGESQTTVAQITAAGGSTTGGTIIGDYVYYVDEEGAVYTIVTKTDGNEVNEGFDFSNTTVAFAVVWKPELVEDTVVIDFGLDVVIDVATNDALASGVVGVRTDAPSGVTMNSGNYTAAKATSVNSTDSLWTASVENLSSVRFHMNEMGINDAQTFYYESDVNYYTYDSNNNATLNTTSMYSKVTVIPATTIYYEDSFVDYAVYTNNSGTWELDEDATWASDGTTINATQDVDRPGARSVSMNASYDADNVYGYDSAYDTCSKYSLGSARYVSVDETTYGTATFTFYGTGFDLVSLTSNNTGTITTKVYKGAEASGTSVKNVAVDTYYGYTKDTDGNWIVDEDAENSLYQIPVITVSGLDYGQYTVVVKCAYNTVLDHQKDGGYNFYLDAVRIYDPAGTDYSEATDDTNDDIDDTVIGAYVADGEGWPIYEELRDNVIAASDFTSGTIAGVTFIDGVEETASLSDYTNYGPNNELYLDKGQAIVFNLDLANYGDIIASVQLGMKSADGTDVKYAILDGESISNSTDITGAVTTTISTSTDMYYDLTSLKDAVIVIYNAGDGILSLTNIKVTFTEEPTDIQNLCYVDYDVIEAVIENMNTSAIFEPTIEMSLNNIIIDDENTTISIDAGKNISVSVSTSADVEALSVNGSMLKTYTTVDESRVWTTEVSTSSDDVENGKEIAVIAYNSKGIASESASVTVTVTENTTSTIANTISSIINGIVGKLKSWFGWK